MLHPLNINTCIFTILLYFPLVFIIKYNNNNKKNYRLRFCEGSAFPFGVGALYNLLSEVVLLCQVHAMWRSFQISRNCSMFCLHLTHMSCFYKGKHQTQEQSQTRAHMNNNHSFFEILLFIPPLHHLRRSQRKYRFSQNQKTEHFKLKTTVCCTAVA